MRLKPGIGMQLTAVCLSSFLLVSPLFAQNQTVPGADASAAMADAQRDAQIETNDFIWFVGGACYGLGILLAYALEPSPPAIRLLGKSPEYVAVYSDSYRRTLKGERARMAWVGCGALAGVYLLYFVIFFSAMSQSSSSSSGGY